MFRNNCKKHKIPIKMFVVILLYSSLKMQNLLELTTKKWFQKLEPPRDFPFLEVG